MTRARIIQVVCLLVMVLCMAGVFLLVPPIDNMRRQLLLGDPQFDEQTPWHVQVLTASLGAFRGLAVDVLWYRTNRLKEEGKLYEANQLAQWICDLQPRFSQVWRFQAWNMAYNLSVMTHTPDERWYWVNSGVTLLRDHGIPYNPSAVSLYRELGWIFFHKMGQYTDDMHWYYKSEMARQWQELLGVPTEGTTAQEAAQRFRQIVDAPELPELINQHAQVRQLLVAAEKLGYQPDETLLREIGKVLMFNYANSPTLLSAAKLRPSDRYDAALGELIQKPQFVPAVELLLNHLRRRVLEDSYHMDPQHMHELMVTFGPLDWRNPAAHAVYWASMGVKVAGKRRVKTNIDLLNTDRQVIHGFQNLMRFGKVEYEPVTGSVDLSPDPRFIAAYDKAVDAARQRVLEGEVGPVATGTPSSFDTGHENFLLSAVTFHYFFGDEQEAHKYYKKLRDLYGDKPKNIRSGRFLQPLDQLVIEQWAEIVDMKSNTLQFDNAMLYQAFTKGLANGRIEVYNRFVKLARMAFEKYHEGKLTTPNAPKQRLGFGPWSEHLALEYGRYLKSPTQPLLIRARAYMNAPIELNQRVYDRVRDTLLAHAAPYGDQFDVEAAFPEPPGMAERRREAPQMPEREESVPVAVERL